MAYFANKPQTRYHIHHSTHKQTKHILPLLWKCNRWPILLLIVVTLWVLTRIEKSKTHMSGEEISKHWTNYTDNE